MAPGPKKRNFHTPRNTKNNPASKSIETKNTELKDEISKNADIKNNLSTDSEISQKDKYSKRGLESNWVKYEEPQVDPHADSLRGNDFNVLLSYSVGSGSQLKFQDEKEWDEEFNEDLSLDIQDLVSAMKCIPFHERIGLTKVFDDKTVMNFVSVAANHEISYKLQPQKPEVLENKVDKEISVDPVLNIVEEQGLVESDEESVPVKVAVQDKTEDIINSLASNLSFKTFTDEKVDDEILSESIEIEDTKPEATSNDLDFLLSLNISSKAPVKEENASVSKSTNVDDWLNSILDD